MSRRSFPQIDPALFRHDADEARVERVWQRIEHDLASRHDAAGPGVAASRARTPIAYLAIAATFGAFGAGLFVGNAVWNRHGREPVASSVVTPAPDKSLVEVLAAGTQQRTFPLQGGGSLTLSPGATVELVRAGSAVTLALLQGEASVDSRDRALTISAGEARINTQAGSVLSVRRNADDLDVKVDDGSVNVSSPDGSAMIGKSERKAVPIHAAVAPTPTDAKPARIPAPRRPTKARGGIAKVSGPEWMVKHMAGDDEAALAILQKKDVQEAIRSATTVGELDAIADLMRVKNPGAAILAYRRIIDAFPNDQHAFIAAKQLASIYGEKGEGAKVEEYQALASKLAPQTGRAGDSLMCNGVKDQIRNEKDKSRAAALVKEYLDKYPDGVCHEEFEQIAQGAAAAAPAPAASGDAPPAASAPLAPPAP